MSQISTRMALENMQNYEGCPSQNDIEVEGPESKHICLISETNDVFVVKRKHALYATTLRAMLTGPFEVAEGEVNEIQLKYSSPVLKMVCEYMVYKDKHTNSTLPLPSFEFSSENVIDGLLAADFLGL